MFIWISRVLIFLLALGLVYCQHSPIGSHPDNFSNHNLALVWIDTDPSVGVKDRDVDDGIALIQAFHSTKLSIVGVSIVFGNTDIDHAYPIGKNAVERYGPRGLSIFRGASSASELGKETEASQALSLSLQKKTLTILALGPLTNVATTLMKHPELAKNIDRVIAVAGRRPGQRFTSGSVNKKAHRDFNFEMDSEAFRVLLNSNIPLVLTPFEISSKVWLYEGDLDKFALGNPATKWLAPHAQEWLKLWRQLFSVNGFNPFDTLAVGYITDRPLYSCEDLPIAIQILPDDRTEERLQGDKPGTKPYLIVSGAQKTNRIATYCYSVDPRFKTLLMSNLLNEATNHL